MVVYANTRPLELKTDLELSMDWVEQFNGRLNKPGSGLSTSDLIRLIVKKSTEVSQCRAEGIEVSELSRTMLNGAQLALEERSENPEKIPASLMD